LNPSGSEVVKMMLSMKNLVPVKSPSRKRRLIGKRKRSLRWAI
jgi:hypothetical protein